MDCHLVGQIISIVLVSILTAFTIFGVLNWGGGVPDSKEKRTKRKKR